MIIIHAFLQVNPDKRDKFLELVQPILTGSQAEPGNNYYILYEQTHQPNSFVILESWHDQAALDHHNQTPHFLEFGKQAEEHALLLEPPKVEIYKAEQ